MDAPQLHLKEESLWDEVLDFLASTPTLQQILEFRLSEAMQERIGHLLDKNRNHTLTGEEKSELDELSRINHFMSMLKLRARMKLAEVE